jgi:hypothetical protein
VHRLDKRQHSSSSNGENKQPHDMIIPSSKFLLDRLKGLDFAAWNKEIGLPTKPKVGELPIFPYEWTVFNSLMMDMWPG